MSAASCVLRTPGFKNLGYPVPAAAGCASVSRCHAGCQWAGDIRPPGRIWAKFGRFLPSALGHVKVKRTAIPTANRPRGRMVRFSAAKLLDKEKPNVPLPSRLVSRL